MSIKGFETVASISFHRADLMYALIELSKVIKKSSSIWECVAVTMKDGNAVLSGSDMKTQMLSLIHI